MNFFLSRIQKTFPKLSKYFSGEALINYKKQYNSLLQYEKKTVSEAYIIDKLNQRLNKSILKNEFYRSQFRYFTEYSETQSYLIAYIFLSNSKYAPVNTALAFTVELDRLKQLLFPQILREGKFPSDVRIAILDDKGNVVLGETSEIINNPVAAERLREPLNFWKLALLPTANNPLLTGGDRWLFSKLWAIFLLWLAIMAGAAFVLYSWRKQQKLSQQKTTFISSITHELKTPLTSIRMFSEFLEKHPSLQNDTEAQDHISVIRSESMRLTQMVENVLDFAKYEQNVKKYRFEYEEPNAIIHQIVDILKYQAQAKSITIEIDLPSELPEIFADRDAIRQALINLLSNAIKYSKVDSKIIISATEIETFLAISIKDFGIGIRKKDQERIFEDYFRVSDPATEHIAGSGLGLPLVKRIIEMHNGKITVESEYGNGSTFTVFVPISE